MERYQAGFVRGTVETRERVFVASGGAPGLAGLSSPFWGPVGAALAREALLIAEAWNPCLYQSSQKEPPIWL